MILQGCWMGSLWPTNERKSLNLPVLLVVLMEMAISMKMNQSFRKVTNFTECVAIYGADAFVDGDTKKAPTTKIHFHVNTEASLVNLLNKVIMEQAGETTEEDEQEFMEKVMRLHVKRFFFELQMTCKEARKWGCAENCIIEK